MELEQLSQVPEGSSWTQRDVEESFEDPFCIRLMPESEMRTSSGNRYYLLGKSLAGKMLFSVFWTNGKIYRVITSREMSEAEAGFYERRNAETLA